MGEERRAVGERKGTLFRSRNARSLHLGRMLLLLICWSVGLFLVFGRTEAISGGLLILGGLWLLLDNPLDFFAVLEGPCPSCGQRVAKQRCSQFRCPDCNALIGIHDQRFYTREDEVTPDPEPGQSDEPDGEGLAEEPVFFVPGDTLDLHTFLPADVPSLISDFLDLCQRNEIVRARIIHGKGTGVLRRRVRTLLVRDARVVAYYDAHPNSGGWGATIVEVRLEARKSRKKA